MKVVLLSKEVVQKFCNQSTKLLVERGLQCGISRVKGPENLKSDMELEKQHHNATNLFGLSMTQLLSNAHIDSDETKALESILETEKKTEK